VRWEVVPLHRDGIHIRNGIAIEGRRMLMVDGTARTNWGGPVQHSLLDAYAFAAAGSRAPTTSRTVKLTMLVGMPLLCGSATTAATTRRPRTSAACT